MKDILLSTLAHVLVLLLPMGGGCYAIYLLLTMPLRRRERSSMFLAVLAAGIKQGHSAENAIVSLAWRDDPAMGNRFRRIAVHIEDGLSFRLALTMKNMRDLPTNSWPICISSATGLTKQASCSRSFRLWESKNRSIGRLASQGSMCCCHWKGTRPGPIW